MKYRSPVHLRVFHVFHAFPCFHCDMHDGRRRVLFERMMANRPFPVGRKGPETPFFLPFIFEIDLVFELKLFQVWFFSLTNELLEVASYVLFRITRIYVSDSVIYESSVILERFPSFLQPVLRWAESGDEISPVGVVCNTVSE